MTEELESPADSPTELIDGRLRLKLRIYIAIAAIMLAIAVSHVLDEEVSPPSMLVALACGVLLGLGLSRVSNIRWDQDAQKVISHFDVYGAIILALYIPFAGYRDENVGYFVHGPAVVASSLALLAGIMTGRVAGMRGKIQQILNDTI